MDDLIEEFLADVKESKATNTHENRRADLKRYDQWLEREEIDVTEAEARDIHRFLREEGSDYAESTVLSRYTSVKLLYDFLAGIWDVMEESPFEEDWLARRKYRGNGDGKKHRMADVVYLTSEEKDELVENVPDPKLRNELVIRLLWQTGVRRGELASIELDDIDREARAIDVYATKTGDWRTVYYQPSLDMLMDQWLDVYRPSYMAAEDSSYLFLTERSEKINEEQVNRIVKGAANGAELQESMYEDADGRERVRVTAHTLRHSHAVHALKSGIDVRTVQEHLGHAKIDTTMKYLRLIDEDVKDSYRKFGSVEA